MCVGSVGEKGEGIVAGPARGVVPGGWAQSVLVWRRVCGPGGAARRRGVLAADAVSEPEIAISSLEIESVERPHQPRSALVHRGPDRSAR